MVAVTYSEITCARCGTEVLAARPKTASASKRGSSAPVDGEANSRQNIGSNLESGTPVFRFDGAHPVTGQAAREPGFPVQKVSTQQPAAVRAIAPEGGNRRSQTRLRVEQPHGNGTSQPVESPSRDEPRATGSMLVFFSGQFLIAWAWYCSSFPAFAGGIVITLAGTFGILRAFQLATSIHRSYPVARQAVGGPKSSVSARRTYSRPNSAE